MDLREVILERIPSQDAVLYINKSGLTFSAKFIKKYKLQNSQGIKFYTDKDDPYFLGFKFTNESNNPNTLSLLKSGRSKGGSAGFTIKASELINNNHNLKMTQSLSNKNERTFEIFLNKDSKIFYILLRPNFEIKVNFKDRNLIDDSIKGIYRYRNKEGQIIYIGKGEVKSRSNSLDRKEWGIDFIEFSIINDEEKSFYWENYYLEKFVASNGSKPPFNVIMGRST